MCDEHKKQANHEYNANRRPDFHKLYSSQAWRNLRDAQLAKMPLCTQCGRLAELAHHVTEHYGNPELFFDENNLESLCRTCHEYYHRRITTARRG